jgi:hypothetical protein
MGDVRTLQVGRGVDEGAQSGDPMGRRRIDHPKRRLRQVADIAVAGDLAPGESVPDLEHRHGVAHHRLSLEPGLEARRAAEGSGGQCDPRRLARDVALGRDDAFQADIGKVGPGRGEAGIASVWHRGACVAQDRGGIRDEGSRHARFSCAPQARGFAKPFAARPRHSDRRGPCSPADSVNECAGARADRRASCMLDERGVRPASHAAGGPSRPI